MENVTFDKQILEVQFLDIRNTKIADGTYGWPLFYNNFIDVSPLCLPRFFRVEFDCKADIERTQTEDTDFYKNSKNHIVQSLIDWTVLVVVIAVFFSYFTLFLKVVLEQSLTYYGAVPWLLHIFFHCFIKLIETMQLHR